MDSHDELCYMGTVGGGGMVGSVHTSQPASVSQPVSQPLSQSALGFPVPPAAWVPSMWVITQDPAACQCYKRHTRLRIYVPR